MYAKVLSGSLLWLPATLAVYYTMAELQRRLGRSPLVNPTLLTITVISLALMLAGVSHDAYFAGVAILHYLLGTAVVALAIPLHRHLRQLDGDFRRLFVGLTLGSLTSAFVGLGVATGLGASTSTVLSLVPKAATAAVSMGIAGMIGGLPPITACITILTGITGAVLGPYILTASGVTTPSARGVALGTVSHGIGTARAFGESEITGCWSSLAMGVNAVVTAILVPIILMVGQRIVALG